MAGMAVAGLMVRAVNREVDRLVGELDATAARDPLTGVLNRRGLDERMGIELTRARRTGEPMTVIACDLDGLKQINDEHGHAAGDEALALAADVMGAGLRDLDVLARPGGDEFLILLPNCEMEAALRIADTLREQVRDAASSESWPATVSMGVACAPPLPLDPEALTLAADRALYRAKALGRDRVSRAGRNELRQSSRPAEFPSLTFRALAAPGEVRGGRAMYEQVFDPVGDSLGLSAIFAVLPLLTLFVMLGGFKVTAWKAGLVSLVVSIVVAIAVYDVPVGQTLNMGLEGAAFGFFPIMWIVINAVWIYNMTESTGHFAVLRRAFASISDDKRIQAIIIAFSFGALIEGLAGFGTPVAITSVMLLALGFQPLKAVALSLIGNTAPVAFGSIATPIVTLSAQTDISVNDLGAMVGLQTPFLALIVPLILVGVVDGSRGVRQTWPAAMVAGVSFGFAQFFCAHYISVELTDILAALFSTGVLVAFLRVWSPCEPMLGDAGAGARPRRRRCRGTQPGAGAQRSPA